MHFCKMNGAGNDFIILNTMEEALPRERLPDIARTLCERHLSLGADGLMAVAPAAGDADFRMLFFNADGSAGEMCGNGARCICRYGYEHGLSGETQTIETTAGIVTGRRLSRRLYRIRLNDPTCIRLGLRAEADGAEYVCSYVELGDPGLPHAVVRMPGLAEMENSELLALGRALRRHRLFPKGANVNFYDVLGDDLLVERTFERGVEDFTYACGTGTGSVVTVLTLQGLVSGRNVRVRMPGGELTIDIDREGDTIRNLFLTGPTNTVASGEITDEELPL